jgi:hypothetical protein
MLSNGVGAWSSSRATDVRIVERRGVDPHRRAKHGVGDDDAVDPAEELGLRDFELADSGVLVQRLDTERDQFSSPSRSLRTICSGV